MYLGIDVGGTKTLVATLDVNGVIIEKYKFPTPKKYTDFLIELASNVERLTTKDFLSAGVGLPVTNFNRDRGVALTFSNLPWKNIPVHADIENVVHCPVAIDNDAKLAGLSESRLRNEIKRLLYVTISTGIGFSLIVDGKIDQNFGDAGGRLMLLEHNGRLEPWEKFASGKAIVNTYGSMAKDITDPVIWEKVARDMCIGLLELVAVTEPELIVIGGSVGEYADRFIKPLNQELKKYETPLLDMPEVEGAKRPNDAVIYGCYDYCLEVFGKQ